MKITYIEHSGFAVETENKILIFDYYKGKMPEFDKNKEIFVFSSHEHDDHFSFDIFKLLEKYENVTYILSKDIRKSYNKKFFEKRGVSGDVFDGIIFMKDGESTEIKGIKVETLKSTDCGVAFVLEADGKNIYHAGDLHDWVWEGENPFSNIAMTNAYRAEIDKIKGRHFDVAFAVVDPRQEGDFYKGAQYLMENITADIFVPMHMWGDYSMPEKLKAHASSEKYRHLIAPKELYSGISFETDI